MTTRKASTTVTYVRIEAVFALHDEVVCVGYSGCIGNLFIGSFDRSKLDVILESIVKENGFLVDIADESAQIMNAKVFNVDAIYEYFALLYIVVTWNKINKCRLSRATLSHQSNHLAFWNNKVDVFQYPLLVVFERHIAEFNLVFKGHDRMWIALFLDADFSLEDFIYALHTGQTFRNVVAGFREFFQRIDDRIEHHEVVDELRAGQSVVVQHKHTTHPKHDNNHNGAEKLTHWMRQLLSDIHSHDIFTVVTVHFIKAFIHQFLCTEGLDDA